jgi:amino acid adenylation domain-containing protein
MTSRLPGPPPSEPYPLTPLQHGLLVQSLRAPGSGVNVEQLVCRLREPLDPERLAAAWAAVVRRHDVLRTRFRWADVPEPVQEPVSEARMEMARHDHAGLAPAEREAQLEAYLEADRARGFDLARAPAMRLALLHRAVDEHVLVWSFHHVLLDGRSVTHLLRELFALYDHAGNGGGPGLPARRPFREHVAWLRGRDRAADEAWWAGVLGGMDAPEPVPPLRGAPRDPAREPPFGERELRLSPAVTAALRAFEAGQGVWLNTLVLGAWALLLGRYTGRGEAVFGVVRAGRAAAAEGAEEMVGLLVNTVPLRVALPPGARVADWLDALGERAAALLAHEHADLADIARWSGLPAGAALFDTLLDFQPQPLEAFRAPGAAWERRDFRMHRRAGVPLAVSVTGESPLRVRIGYDAGRFDAASTDRMLGHFARLLEEIAADPGRRLGALDPLGAEERRRVLEEWNGTDAGVPDGCVPHLVAAQARLAPDAVAVEWEGGTLTRGELEERANRLAHHLARLGVGAESRVGVCLERGPELVAVLLAVLRAGGAFVPLDPAHPADRLGFMLGDSRAAVLVTRGALRDAVNVPPGVRVVDLDQAAGALAAEPADAAPAAPSPRALAYVIYTSGSTGTPRGVAVEHAALASLCAWHARALGLGADDRASQLISAGFDGSVLEIWPALAAGARVQVVPDAVRADPAALRDWMVRRGTTVATSPVSLTEPLLALEWPPEAALRWLVSGADRLRVRPEPGLPFRLTNNYGPTECTAIVTSALVEAEGEGAPGIGRPGDNCRAYVLDDALRPVPVGVPGELCVGGAQVARGYLGRPALTAARFVPDPFGPRSGARLYRTGDQARWLEDGTLDFLGRRDAQVKIRGFRVEPGEVEATLRGLPAVRDCAVVVREDVPGEKRLAAYVVGGADAETLRAHLRGRLPEHMVPAAFVAMEALPLTPNGKVDRRALPEPGESGGDYVAPRTDVERALAAIWAGVLGRERVGVRDGFLDIGGHSLLATQAVAKIREVLGVEAGVAELFEHPTIEALAPRLSARRPPGGDSTVSAESSPHRLLALVDDLSDAELDGLLAARLTSGA